MSILVFDQSNPACRGGATPQLGHVAILLFGKIKVPSQVAAAIKHNRRRGGANWRRAECVDRSRSHMNYILWGPPAPEAVSEFGQQRLATGRRKIREGTILVIEVVVSLPADLLIDRRLYFLKTLKWLAANFGGGANIISADVHLDESAPHMHVLIVPVMEGHMCGNALLGGPAKIRNWLDRFHEEVAQEFGLLRRASEARDGAVPRLQYPVSVPAAEFARWKQELGCASTAAPPPGVTSAESTGAYGACLYD